VEENGPVARREWRKSRSLLLSGICAAATSAFGLCASAETLTSALARAYQNNPQLNAQRAIVRQVDESVPQALSGYRPTLSAAATAGVTYTRNKQGGSVTNPGIVTPAPSEPTVPGPTIANPVATSDSTNGVNYPHGVGITAQQTLFNGFQTANRTRAAESQVSAARETLRVLEQTVLLTAVAVYMDVLRDTQNVAVQRNNVRVLSEGLKETRGRFDIGEVTRTDIAQSETQAAAAQIALRAAELSLRISRANYRRIIGIDPVALVAPAPVDRILPRSLDGALATAAFENPNVTSAMYGVDVAVLQVKVAEGALYPRLGLSATAEQLNGVSRDSESFRAAALLNLTFPIYQGGTEHSQIRQAKELVGQQRFTVDDIRNQVQALVIQAWAQREAATAQIADAHRGLAAAERASRGIGEEAKLGQRTTFDILTAQTNIINARVALLAAQRDKVVSSYTILAAVGRLSPQNLRLPTSIYDPRVHYHQVRDAWTGVRTPEGR
jgi:outer membrane protein